MLAEVIDKLTSLGVQTHYPRIIKAAAEPEHIYWYVDSEGKASRHEAEPRPRNHMAHDLSAIMALCVDCISANPEIWFGRNGVVGYLCGNERRDQVTLPLAMSAQITKLGELGARPLALDQKALVQLLRITFDGCCAPTLVDVFRRLKFRQLAAGEAEIKHGKSSVGKALEAELTGTGALPEQLVLDVPVFAGFAQHLRFPVRVAVEIDAQAERFFLIPFPDQVERAIRDAEQHLGQYLVDLRVQATMYARQDADDLEADAIAKIPILYGSP